MRRFRHLGLQRRIMLYVAVGLMMMLAIGTYLGSLAVRQATDLVYRERLGTSYTTAETIEYALRGLALDVESMQADILRAGSSEELGRVGEHLLATVSTTGPISLVRPESLWLIDAQGQIRLVVPSEADPAYRTLEATVFQTAVEKPVLVAPLTDSKTPLFGTLLVPVKDNSGTVMWTVALHLAGANQEAPYYLPAPVATQRGASSEEPPSSAYILEVLGPGGFVALTKGGKAPVGKVSPHWALLREHGGVGNVPLAFVHRPAESQTFKPHMIAAVPLPSGPYIVMLEQREDVALALPLQLRRRVILFASLGFVFAMLAAWVTTRHVVKPTERLNRAAQRIAAGEVDKPIRVAAQDEIGTLAESLETMRRRLQAWGSELEKQVQERTAQLEDRNKELSGLYETLQKRDEQLRTLLAKVLGAQEDERKRVSRDLHDGIGQSLSALLIGLERLEEARPDQWVKLQMDLQQLRYMATESLRDLRRLTIALRPAALDDLGLVPAIRRCAEFYLAAARISFDVREMGLPARLDPSLETVIYRVAQEAINNAARHSHATKVTVHLRATDGAVLMEVVDNGSGFDISRANTRQGVGLEGMQERASLAGGALVVRSTQGLGTTVSLEVPLREGGVSSGA